MPWSPAYSGRYRTPFRNDTGHHSGLIPDGIPGKPDGIPEFSDTIPEFSDSIPGKPDTGIFGWQKVVG